MPSISTHPTQMSDTLPPNSHSLVGDVRRAVTLSNTIHGLDHRSHPAGSCASAGGCDRDSLADALTAVRLSEFEALILVAAHNGICVGDPINAPTTMRFAAMVLANEVDEYLAGVSLCDGDAAKDGRRTDHAAAPVIPDATSAVAPVRMDPIEGSHAAGELIGASVTKDQRTLIVAKLAAYSFDARLAIVDAIARYWNRDPVRIDACSDLADRLRQVGLVA